LALNANQKTCATSQAIQANNQYSNFVSYVVVRRRPNQVFKAVCPSVRALKNAKLLNCRMLNLLNPFFYDDIDAT
jgi:hypothetical protein